MVSDVVSRLIADVPLPKMAPVCQHFSAGRIEPGAIYETVRAELLNAGLARRLHAGQRVAVTAGSRGIVNIALITKAIADTCLELEAKPFIVPAMGSHGGATAEGQRAVLTAYGITEAYCGCPILSSMETVEAARTRDGESLYMDRHAATADAIIVCGRIKPHTAFRGPYESGLMKMLVVGLGKQKGADAFHGKGYGNFARLLPAYGKLLLENKPVIMGLGLLENAFDETCLIRAVPPERFEADEPELLERAKRNMAKIYFAGCDILIIDRIGKDISGDGADPNITGAFATPYAGGGISTQRIAILDISPGTRNPLGVSGAHVTTRRLYEKADLDQMYINCITSRILEGARMPLVVANDREALQICLKTCPTYGAEGPTVIRIADTLHLSRISVSENLLGTAAQIPELEIVAGASDIRFDEQGNFAESLLEDL
ncbi:MAG: DUF362 domain-containing protein [Clostridiales Family XIII bacterium]|jgi:hypothetical protein|nr:DUF362 domain-containing protein [Clostridiales Family XIII bacterium]